MNTNPINPADFQRSVVAHPPLARQNNFDVCPENNRRIIQHIEQGGIDILLYATNANFAHIRPSEYERTLEVLADCCSQETRLIPAAGPGYGTLMDQAVILKRLRFSSAMVLPNASVMTEPGFMNGFRNFVQALGHPAALCINNENDISPEAVAELVEQGEVSFIQYAIAHDNREEDAWLSRLVERVDPSLILSGLGEQQAMVHITKFRCAGFVSGGACINPALSMQFLKAVHDKNYDLAENIRSTFSPLEDLCHEVHAIRILHEAVSACDIADVGPYLPMLSGLASSKAKQVKIAATTLLNSGT